MQNVAPWGVNGLFYRPHFDILALNLSIRWLIHGESLLIFASRARSLLTFLVG